MKTKIPEKIETIEEAKKFFDELISNREEFHPEDDPFDIIYFGTGKRLFTDEEAAKIDKLMDEVYSLEGFDPCEYILDQTNSES